MLWELSISGLYWIHTSDFTALYDSNLMFLEEKLEKKKKDTEHDKNSMVA